MRVAFFEDSCAANFHPIALARPVFELVCGRYSLRERLVRHLPVTEWGVFVRDHLAETYREAHPEAHVNDFIWLSQAPTLVINGRWLPSADAIRADFETSGTALVDGEVAFTTLEPFEAALVMRNGWEPALAQIARGRRSVEPRGFFLRYLWDLVRHNAAILREDFRLAGAPTTEFRPAAQVATLGNERDFHIDPTARIDPFVVLDATDGPIAIGPGAIVKPFSHISGPCEIGHRSQLFAATLRGGTTIGPECRVGGEVEGSILHGYANKYHAGFLGHSYICPWVNLGALTTNSDLKNDYTHIRVPVSGESIDSGLTKIGCFIADYAKTSIGTLLNTGSSIGPMSMILPDGKLAPKHIPAFAKVLHGDLTDGADIEQSLRSARLMMGRRNVELSGAAERMWRRLFVLTRAERENAIRRFRDRDYGRLETEGWRL